VTAAVTRRQHSDGGAMYHPAMSNTYRHRNPVV